MNNSSKIINELLNITDTLNRALKIKNLDVIEQMLKEREPLIALYEENKTVALSDQDQENIDALLKIEKENNQLMELLYKEAKNKLNQSSKNRSDIKKRNDVAKKYVVAGTQLGGNSRFNKKT